MIYGVSNQLEGTVVSILEGAVNATITIELKSGETVTSSLTMDSLHRLGLKVGDTAYACIKATDVVIAREGD